MLSLYLLSVVEGLGLPKENNDFETLKQGNATKQLFGGPDFSFWLLAPGAPNPKQS